MFKILLTAVFVLLVIGFIVNKPGEELLMETTSVATQSGNEEQIDSAVKESVDVGYQAPVTSSSKVLDLSGQGLTKAPNYIFDKTNLQELNLSNNKLEGALQAEVRHLQNLKVLNLSNNTFTGLPAEIGQLKNLEVLDLSNNQLTGLPYELGNLSSLKVLNLKGNVYSEADLNIIKQGLPSIVVIQTD